MVEERLKLDLEVQEILSHIDNGDNFLLSGGAGSGKTYSLIQVIRQVILENPLSKVACMTYTNAAVKEIEERVNHENLSVSTIHDFLWDNIKHFKKEIRDSLVVLINEDKIKNPEEFDLPNNYFDSLKDGIQYKEYLKIKEGCISHDEILILANFMFQKYQKLCDILKDRYRFLFIDEYQDTSSSVVELLLVHLKKSAKKTTIGFFGDTMQSIYDSGIGDLDVYKNDVDFSIKEVKKTQNRRNPKLIIELANKLRSDGIIQVPSDDISAPNMVSGVVKEGDISFYYSNTNNSIDLIESKLGWDFNDSRNTKILNLTHNLIAPKAGFQNLMSIYDKDPIIGLKNDIIKKIKDNKEGGKPEIEFGDNDSFDMVVDKFKLRTKKEKGEAEAKLKKNIILQNPDFLILYNQLKDLPFSEVRKIYLDKELLIDDKKQNKDEESKKGSKRDDLIKHLFKIQNNIQYYKNKQFNDFLRKTEYKITSLKDKITLKKSIDDLVSVADKTIDEIIDDADRLGICKKDERLIKFISDKKYIYNRVKAIKYLEFQNLYNYLEGYTPFSTQHKTKGTEFDNVLVVLDSGGWFFYNFNDLFVDAGEGSVKERTKKIFYVCCTRAKENLALFFYNPASSVIDGAKKMFGEKNVIEI